MTNHVAEHQSRRIRKATIEAAAELGFANLSVQAILARAGVSRVTFYKLFSSKHDAFHKAINGVVSQIWESGPPDLAQILALVYARPQIARCFLIELPAVAPESYEDYQRPFLDDAAVTA